MNSLKKIKHPKELECLNNIVTALKGEKMEIGKQINNTTIDIYFPEKGLAIYCSIYYKRNCVLPEYITESAYNLDASVYAFNPLPKEFDIFEVINKIYRFGKD